MVMKPVFKYPGYDIYCWADDEVRLTELKVYGVQTHVAPDGEQVPQFSSYLEFIDWVQEHLVDVTEF